MAGSEEAAMDKATALREIADCLDETVRLQSRITELTEEIYRTAGIGADRGLRGRVTGLFFGVQAHLEEMNRLVREET
jgi:hypothetical protein